MRALVLTMALLLVPAPSCKKEEPIPLPQPVAQPLAGPASGESGAQADPRRAPGFREEKIPPELNPATSARIPAAIVAQRSVSAMRRHAGGPSVRVGQGSVSLTVGEGPSVTLPAVVYRRGPIVVIAGDRPDLGIVLSVPTLQPGRYLRSDAQTALPAPNLRLRTGLADLSVHFQAADQPSGTTLRVDVGAGGPGGWVSGTFEGQVSRDEGQVVRAIKGGSFELRVDSSTAPVAEGQAGGSVLPPVVPGSTAGDVASRSGRVDGGESALK